MKKVRLDSLLMDLRLFTSKSKAQAAIMAGMVSVNGHRIDKCGTFVNVSDDVAVDTPATVYASRGGNKLEKALSDFQVDPAHKVAADIGASTGGFTDCLLQHGCTLVYAIDVGYGQLDMRIRKDNRVLPIERTNARNLTWDSFLVLTEKAIRNEHKQGKCIPVTTVTPVDIVVMDVSFISILKVLPAVKTIMDPKGDIISLIKPQFEARREQVGKGGIIRDPEVHREVIDTITSNVIQLGLQVCGLCESPISGTDGNREFLIHLRCR